MEKTKKPALTIIIIVALVLLLCLVGYFAVRLLRSSDTHGGSRAENYFLQYKNGYAAVCEVTRDGETVEMQIAEKDGKLNSYKTVLTAYGEEYETTLTVFERDGKLYTVDFKKGSFVVGKSYDTLLSLSIENYSHFFADTGSFDGALCDTEEYDLGGMTVRFYFDGSLLVGIKHFAFDEEVLTIRILSISGELPADLFTVPDDFEENVI